MCAAINTQSSDIHSIPYHFLISQLSPRHPLPRILIFLRLFLPNCCKSETPSSRHPFHTPGAHAPHRPSGKNSGAKTRAKTSPEILWRQKKVIPLQPQTPKARMAESVDALVSNTSGFTSMPVRSRLRVLIGTDAVQHPSLFLFLQTYIRPSDSALLQNQYFLLRLHQIHIAA